MHTICAMADETNPIVRLRQRAREAGWGVELDETLQFERPELKHLYDLWRLKAAALNDLPTRADLDARMLKPFLRHLTIVERAPDADGKPHFRFRLQGSALVQHFGEQTGKLLENSIPPGIVEAWNTGYDALLKAKKPVRVLTFYQMPSVDYLTGESFSVPLGNPGGTPTSVLTVTYFRPRAGGL
jgi:hypothetical protein